MITPKEIERKTMSEEKRREARNSYFSFYIGRPISYVFTIPFLYTNISPNTVTVFSIIFSVAGFIVLSTAKTIPVRLIGLLLFFLWNICDGIDGNIARYKNLKSANGDLLDTLGGYMSMVLILLAMGNAAYNDSNGMTLISAMFPVSLSAVSAAATLIPRLLTHRKIAMNKSSSNAEKLKDKESYGLAKIIALNICDPAGFQQVFMLISIVFSLNTQFTVVYFLINIAVMAYSILNLLEKEQDNS